MSSSFYSHSFSDLQEMVTRAKLPEATARHLFNWHYKKNQREPCRIHNFSKKAQEYVAQNFNFHWPEIYHLHQSTDKTVKFVFKLSDNAKIETVLIPFQNKYTLCLSSQVGCAMNCSFCFTGTQGFSRHLKAEEIVGQFMVAQNWLSRNRPKEDRILNLVFMGQGEPLHNFDAVKKSVEIFLSQYGVSLACHKITVSTAGYLPGLLRWEQEMPNVNIALSLHSALSEKRQKLIPLEKKYPLLEIFPIIDKIPKDPKRFVTYEYLLIEDFNDSLQDAQSLMNLLKDRKAYINIIPFNSFPNSRWKRPSPERVREFADFLKPAKIPTLVRTTKGDDILAACGQLNTKSLASH